MLREEQAAERKCSERPCKNYGSFETFWELSEPFFIRKFTPETVSLGCLVALRKLLTLAVWTWKEGVNLPKPSKAEINLHLPHPRDGSFLALFFQQSI
jgi:hypothetical protein